MGTQQTASEFQDWEQLRAALVQAIAALAAGDALVVGEPTRTGPPTGLLRRAKPLPSRYVQFAADGAFVVAECVGSTAFGGEWEIRDDVDMSLVSRNTVKLESHQCSLVACQELDGRSLSRIVGCRTWCRWGC